MIEATDAAGRLCCFRLCVRDGLDFLQQEDDERKMVVSFFFHHLKKDSTTGEDGCQACLVLPASVRRLPFFCFFFSKKKKMGVRGR